MLNNKTAKNCNNIFLIFVSISLIIPLLIFYTPISYSQTDSDQFVSDNTTDESFGDTNGDGVVDALDEATASTTETTTTDNASSTDAVDEIQMDTNGDGVVDALDETTASTTETTTTDNASSTDAVDEIQMDTNGDGVVDATSSGDDQLPESGSDPTTSLE